MIYASIFKYIYIFLFNEILFSDMIQDDFWDATVYVSWDDQVPFSPIAKASA